MWLGRPWSGLFRNLLLRIDLKFANDPITHKKKTQLWKALGRPIIWRGLREAEGCETHRRPSRGRFPGDMMIRNKSKDIRQHLRHASYDTHNPSSLQWPSIHRQAGVHSTTIRICPNMGHFPSSVDCLQSSVGQYGGQATYSSFGRSHTNGAGMERK